MLTHFRHKPPLVTGDWRRDGPVWQKQISDYWLSLEQKGALAIQPQDISHLPIFQVDDYIADSHADDTIGITAAAAALVARGGGILSFGAGKTYTVLTSVVTRIMDLRYVTGHTTILGNGATIVSAQVDTSSTAILIDVTENGGGLHVTGLNFTGGNTTLRAAGEQFLIGANGVKNVCVENCKITNCQTGINYYGQIYANANKNLIFRNNICTRVYYPLVCYQTDNIYAEFQSINGGRSVFLGAPVNNFDISVDSQHGGPFSDIEIIVYADSALTVAQNTISNGRINYFTAGRYSGSGDQQSQEGLVHFILLQLDADSSSGHFRDINVHICADANATDQPSNAVMFSRYGSSATLTGDGTSRTHTIRNLSFSGALLNWNNATGSGVVLFPVTSINGTAMNWTSDLIENISVVGLHINGAPPTYSVYASGQGAVSGKRFLSFDRYQGGAPTLANHTSAWIEGVPIATTPGVSFNGGTTDLTYTTQTGSAVVRDGVVTERGVIVINSNGTSSGAARITGLRHAVRNSNDSVGAASIAVDGVTYTGTIQGVLEVGAAAIVLQNVTEAGSTANLDETNIGDGDTLYYTAVYRAF